MFGNVIGLVITLLVAAGAVWLVIRIRRRPSRLAKWGGTIGLGFVAFLATLFTVLELVGIIQVYAPRGNPVADVTVEITPDLVAHGESIAKVICAACHSIDGDLPLSGGDNILEDVPFPLGKATPPNLTPSGRLANWSDGEIQRIIREGTDPDGHLMPIMASQNFRVFSQEDLDAIVAFLRSQSAATDGVEPDSSLTPLAMAMMTLGMLPVKEVPDPVPPPPWRLGQQPHTVNTSLSGSTARFATATTTRAAPASSRPLGRLSPA